MPTIATRERLVDVVRAALLEVARDQEDAVVDAVAGDDRAEERGRGVEVADRERRERRTTIAVAIASVPIRSTSSVALRK